MVIISLLAIRRTVMSLMRWDRRVCPTSLYESTTVLRGRGPGGSASCPVPWLMDF